MILVIGAGVTGLTFSSSVNGNVRVLEADDEVGGYCRTTYRNGFVWDRAGHFFHFKDDSVKSFFKKHINSDDMIEVEKKTSIYWKGLNIDFPFQNNIHQLPKDIYIDCLIDLYNAEIDNVKQSSTFKDFVYSKLGKTISEEFLIPYNEKLYACDLNELDKDAMGRFFPQSDFGSILKNARKSNNKSYNQFFSYPKYGAKTFIDILEKKSKDTALITKNCKVKSVNIDKKYVTLTSGEKIEYDYLVNTAPLNKLIEMCGINSTNHLSANKVAVFNLGFDSKVDSVTDHWIYFPGNEIFYRVGCYHNIFSESNASFYVEIGLKTDDVFNEEKLLNHVLMDLKKVGLINDKMMLIDHEFVLMNPAYVHINESGECLKNEVKEYLANNNIYTAGRYGDWKYCSIEDNILEAISLAKLITEKSLGKYSSRNLLDE